MRLITKLAESLTSRNSISPYFPYFPYAFQHSCTGGQLLQLAPAG
jgi:hypothetical protein